MIAKRVLACAIVSFLAPVGISQNKPPISPADYDQWESLGGITLSPDGRWITTAVRRGNGESELVLRGRDTTDEAVVPYGSRPTFSPDSMWLAYTVGMSTEEREELGESARDKMVLLHLESGESTETESPSAFGFSPDSQFLVMRHPSTTDGAANNAGGRGRRGRGRGGRGGGGGGVASGPADNVVVRDLASGVDTKFGNITQYTWLPSGHQLAMVISSSDKTGNGIRLYDPAEGRIIPLHSSAATYSGLTLREDSDDLAALVTHSVEGYENNTHTILAWRGLASGTAAHDPFVFDPTTAEGFPAETRINTGVRWSDSGDALIVSVSAWERTEEEERGGRRGRGGRRDQENGDADEDKSNVQIWHSTDLTLFPAQSRGRQTDQPQTAIVHLDSGAFHPIDNGIFEQIRLLPGQSTAVALDDTPYEFDAMFGRGRRDVYLVDAATGEHREVVKGVLRAPSNSPGGRYLLYMKEHQYFIHDVESGTTRNLTSNIQTSFVNLENDHPVPEKPGHGVAGWLADDRAVIVYDKYDLWRIASDGSGATRLTDGADRGLVMRLVRLDADEDYLDLSKPTYLSLSSPVTKASGFGILDGEGVHVSILLDKAVTGLTRAEEADVYAYTIGAYDDSPDYFVGGSGLEDATQITNTNAFQGDFAWGRSEIVQYTNKRGLNLQGALFYPAGYVEGRQYPMVVYMYEKVSQSVHRYVNPSETSPYNTTVFTSNGYFVLQPDIVFEARKPGPSVLDCVESAVGKVISMGLVDPERIGCVGHSWGGYDSSYLATHSDVFATAIAGAPVTNLLTMWGTISEGGSPETSHNEVGQERMDVPWWKDLDAYIKSSPVHGIQNMNRPMLMCFGGSDGNVNPLLGYEFYNAARRLGKEMVLLVYPGENHSLRQKPNQIDYQQRILEWYATYLKGEPAPAWITEGIRFADIEAERERIRIKAEQSKRKDISDPLPGNGSRTGTGRKN